MKKRGQVLALDVGDHYSVTAEDDAGIEGTLGVSVCGARENAGPCP